MAVNRDACVGTRFDGITAGGQSRPSDEHLGEIPRNSQMTAYDRRASTCQKCHLTKVYVLDINWFGDVWGGPGRLSLPPCPVRVAHTTPTLFRAGDPPRMRDSVELPPHPYEYRFPSTRLRDRYDGSAPNSGPTGRRSDGLGCSLRSLAIRDAWDRNRSAGWRQESR
jgi:hypothetical protein